MAMRRVFSSVSRVQRCSHRAIKGPANYGRANRAVVANSSRAVRSVQASAVALSCRRFLSGDAQGGAGSSQSILELFENRDKHEEMPSDKIDWLKHASRFSNPADRESLIDLRAVLARMEAMIREAPRDDEVTQIDWDMWRKRIRMPGAVDEIQEAYEDMMDSVPEMSEMPEEFNKFEQEALQKAMADTEEVVKEFRTQAEEVRQHLAAVREEKYQLPNLTYQDMIKKHPEWEKEFQEKYEKDDWSLPQPPM